MLTTAAIIFMLWNVDDADYCCDYLYVVECG